MRALNAVKLERVFAKPFIGNLDGHRDAISCLKKHPNRLALLASGDFNGEVRHFNYFWTISCLFTNFNHVFKFNNRLTMCKRQGQVWEF